MSSKIECLFEFHRYYWHVCRKTFIESYRDKRTGFICTCYHPSFDAVCWCRICKKEFNHSVAGSYKDAREMCKQYNVNDNYHYYKKDKKGEENEKEN